MSDEDAQYQQWRSRLPKELQYEGDYDLRGFWRENPGFSASSGQHLTDKFKLPNHPTFSDQSQYYNDSTKHLGGTWQKNDYNGWSFVPNDPRFKKPIVEDVAGRPVEEEPAGKPRMRVTDAIAKMREAGYGEDEIFKAIAKKPEMVAQYQAEKAEARDALMARKLPEGMEDLQGQAKDMTRHKWTVGLDEDVRNLKNFATGAADAVGRATNAFTPLGLSNKALNAVGVDTSGQERLPAPVRIAADAAGGYLNPVNKAAGAVGGAIGARIAGAAPATEGALQTVGRFLAGAGGATVGGATAGALGQAADEGGRGFQPGWGARTIGGGLLGGAMGAVGGVAAGIGKGLQGTKGVRARQYAQMGEEEARAIVAKGEPPVGSPGYRDYEAARDILKSPQSGRAAYLGLNRAVEENHPDVGPAYEAADARAARDLQAFESTRDATAAAADAAKFREKMRYAGDYASAQHGLGEQHIDRYRAERLPDVRPPREAVPPLPQASVDAAMAPRAREVAGRLQGIDSQAADAIHGAASQYLADARPLLSFFASQDSFVNPKARSAMAPIFQELEQFAVPGKNGEMFVPANALKKAQQAIGNAEAWRKTEGVSPSDIAPVDAIARRLNAAHYGEADRLKAGMEVDRERARAAMGLRDEPLVSREAGDVDRLQAYMQPRLHGGHYGVVGNITANAQALSGMPPVQSIARFMAGAGPKVASPQLAPAASEALQNWMAQKQRSSAIIDTIFSKKKPDDGQQQEDSNGVRQ